MKKLLVIVFALFTLAGCQIETTVDVKVPELKTPSVFYFSSDHCGWCKKFDPNWNTVTMDTTFRNIIFYDETHDYIPYKYNKLFGIKSVPAVVFVDSDGKVTKLVGYQSKNQLRKNLIKYLK